MYIDQLGHLGAVDPEDREFIAAAFAGVRGPMLDAGCGPGHLTALLHDLGHSVTGVDAVSEFVAHARRAHPDVTYAVGTIEHLDHRDSSLQGALAWYSLIHLTADGFDGALTELRRVIAPAGVLVLGLFHADEVRGFAHQVTTATAWPQHEIAGRLERAGFEPTRWDLRPATAHQRPHLAVGATRR